MTETQKYFWRGGVERLVLLLPLVKLWFLLQNVIYPGPDIDPVNVTHKLETIYNPATDTFNISDLTNVREAVKNRECVHQKF